MAYCDECIRQSIITDPVLMLAEIQRLQEENAQLKKQLAAVRELVRGE